MRVSYPNSVGGHDNVGSCFDSVLKLDLPIFSADLDRLVVNFQDTCRALAWFFKRRFNELFVNINSVKIIIVL